MAKKKKPVEEEEIPTETKTERSATDNNVESGVVKPHDQEHSHETDQSTATSETKSINSRPSKRTKRYRFSKEVDGKTKTIKSFKMKLGEAESDARERLKERGWTSDESLGTHTSADGRSFHVGRLDKCPRCVSSVLKSGGPEAKTPEMSTLPLNTVEDVKKAWTTIPANTVPYFELAYYEGDLVLPLFSKPVSINRAAGLLEKSKWLISKKPELKATITGKAESHECPGALSVRVTLAGDVLKFLKRTSGIVAWAPALLGADEKFDKKRVTLKPRVQVAYTPQKYKPEVIDVLKVNLGDLKEDAFEPKEENVNGRFDKEGNEAIPKGTS